MRGRLYSIQAEAEKLCKDLAECKQEVVLAIPTITTAENIMEFKCKLAKETVEKEVKKVAESRD